MPAVVLRWCVVAVVTLAAASALPTPQALPVPDAADALCGVLPVDPLAGCLAWQHRYEGPSTGDDGPADIAVSPDGSRVFTVGFSYVRPPGATFYDYVTIAHDATSGAVLWEALYDGPAEGGGPAKGDDFGMAVATSPDGTVVYVTGLSFGYVASANVSATGVATVAYDAVDGTRLWVAREHGSALGVDVGRDVATSPDGSLLYVTATMMNADQDVALFTYDAATGARVAAHEYNGPGARHDSNFFRSLVVTPDGHVFVAAQVYAGPATGFDYGLLRYAPGGAFLGASLYDGGEGNVDRAFGIAAAPDGEALYVTGRSRLASSGYDFLTVAFGADGATRWTARYDGDGQSDEAYVVAASPDGAHVVATGTSLATASGYDYATVLVDAATGSQEWVTRSSSPGAAHDVAHVAAWDPTSRSVFVTGRVAAASASNDQATMAYEAATGAPLWAHTYSHAAAGDDIGRALAVDPEGARLYVTGDSYTSAAAGFDIATIALDLGAFGALPPLPLP